MVLSLDRWVGKVAIVTGASAGIGAAIAEQLVEHGLKVAAFARRIERLEEQANQLVGKKGKLYPVKVDVTIEEDILNGFKWVKENLGPVHVLINNAGGGGAGTLIDGETTEWERVFQLNVIGLSIATREAIKDMKENNVDGHIFHINSIVGHQVLNIPEINVYPASKFAVTALAETLRLELNSLKSKIKITNISPGLVDSEIVQIHLKPTEKFKKIYEERSILDCVDIANAVIYALSTPPHVQIQELTIRPVIDPEF